MSNEKKDCSWRLVHFGLALMFSVFSIQFYLLVSQLNVRPTASSFSLVDDVPPRMPAITICPAIPFTPDMLIELGMNTSCDKKEDCNDALMALDGLPEDLDLEELLKVSLLPLPSYVLSSSIHSVDTIYQAENLTWPHWNVSKTSVGLCWTLIPPPQKRGASIQPINLRLDSQIPCSKLLSKTSVFDLSQEIIEDSCNTSYSVEKLAYSFYDASPMYLVLLHSANEPPTIIDNQNVIQVSSHRKTDHNIVTWFSVREISMLESTSCISGGDYSFSKCVSLCYENTLENTMNDTDYDFDNFTKKCHIRQFLHMRKFLLKNHDTYEKDIQVIKCKQTCKPNCKHTQYEFTTEHLVEYDVEDKGLTKTNMLTLRVSAPYTEYVTEEEIYGKAKFLSDLGGSLGLCFGVGLLTLYQYGFSLLQKLKVWRMRLKSYLIPTTEDHLDASNYDTLFWTHTKSIWLICGICLSLIVFAAHSIQLTLKYLKYETVFVTNLVRDPPPFPSVTLCPDVPFDMLLLTEYGLSYDQVSNLVFCHSGRYCDRRLVIPYLMNNLPGIWESNVSLANVWNAKREVDFLESFKFDNIVDHGMVTETLTTMGNCYTISPGKFDVNPLILDIAFADLSIYLSKELFALYDIFYDNHALFYNISFLVHPGDSPPLYLDGLDMTYDSRNLVRFALEVRAMKSRRISTPRRECHKEPYSRKNCMDACLLEEEAKAVGCRLPYLSASTLPLCSNRSQYAKSVKYNDLKHMTVNEMCQDKCKIECNSVHYSLRPLAFVYEISKTLSEIHLKQQLSYSLEISEQLKTSFETYLCELGGIMGLYLGISILDLTSWCAKTIRKSMRHIRLVHSKKVAYIFRALEILWWLMICTLLMIFSINRLQEFYLNPKIYTRYSDQVHEWKHFPGITLCQWPPFNLTSLVSRGIDIEIKELCGKGFFKNIPSCKGNFYNLMNILPGLENDSITDIWEQTSWNLSDLLHSYSVNGQEYMIGLTPVPHWKPIQTSLNKCFTFVPPTDTRQVSDLSIVINIYYYNFKFKGKPPLFKHLLWLVLGVYSPHTLIRIHSPQDTPVLNEDVYEIPVYLHSKGYVYKVTTTLTEVSRLKTANRKCNDDEDYSAFNCVQQCLLDFIAHQENCKVPFFNSSSVELCNITSYQHFPKYLDQVSTKLHNYTRLKKECMSQCPISCNSYSYKVTGKQSLLMGNVSTGHVKLVITMGRDRHDKFEEIPALTWSTFVAEVGGVAGTLTGMSLLMLLQVLLETFSDVYKYVKVGRKTQ